MGKKILLVDDEPDVLKVLSTRLEVQGHEIYTTMEPKRGLSLVDTFKPDLILLDVMMPDMDGGDFLRELKKKNSSKNIPVIFMSAAYNDSSYEDYESKGINVDGNSFPALGKPIDMQKLIKIMNKIFYRT